jgi:hypothetical protein
MAPLKLAGAIVQEIEADAVAVIVPLSYRDRTTLSGSFGPPFDVVIRSQTAWSMAHCGADGPGLVAGRGAVEYTSYVYSFSARCNRYTSDACEPPVGAVHITSGAVSPSGKTVLS